MKVTAIEKTQEIKYPCLMKTSNGKIVLFTESRCGVVLRAEEGADWIVGEYCTEWAMDCFSLYEGKITLEND